MKVADRAEAVWRLHRPTGKGVGLYPLGFLDMVYKEFGHGLVLHVCSGTVEGDITVDIRPESRPTIIADALQLPFQNNIFDMALADPPYNKQWAKKLWGVKYPSVPKMLDEMVRVVKPLGLIGLLHLLFYGNPAGVGVEASIPVVLGPFKRVRLFQVWRKLML